jgi:hypothetical protein
VGLAVAAFTVVGAAPGAGQAASFDPVDGTQGFLLTTEGDASSRSS